MLLSPSLMADGPDHGIFFSGALARTFIDDDEEIHHHLMLLYIASAECQPLTYMKVYRRTAPGLRAFSATDGDYISSLR